METLPGFPTSDVDLWDDAILADPYPAYRALRDLGPVVWLERPGLLALPRFDVVRSVLTSWHRFSSASGVGIDEQTNAAQPESVIKSDPPEHDEHRRLLAAQLSIASLASAAGDIERAADALIATLVARGSFDAVADLARPYSLNVVGDLIGLPADGREQLPHLAEQAFNVFGPANERLTTAPPALEQILGLPRARSVRCDSKPRRSACVRPRHPPLRRHQPREARGPLVPRRVGAPCPAVRGRRGTTVAS